MNTHKIIGDVGLYSSLTADGGPRRYTQCGLELPERYLPGRYLAMLSQDFRSRLINAINDKTSEPATWWLELIIHGDDQPSLPIAPYDRWPRGR